MFHGLRLVQWLRLFQSLEYHRTINKDKKLLATFYFWKQDGSISFKDLRIIRIQMGNQNGDGMDGGKFGNQNWGGGRFSFKLCFQDESRCCETGKLKTEDDNWEKGQVNYFVGFQMGACENFALDGKGNMMIH